MVIAPKNFRDEEYFHTKEELENTGFKVVTACSEKKAVSQVELTEVNADILLKDAKVNQFDAVVFVGGAGSACYFKDKNALSIAKEAFQSNKVIAAICMASSVLANSGVLKGKKATGWPSEKDNIIVHGGNYTGEDVTVDGTVITSNGPHAAREFGRKIADRLKED